MAVTYNNVWWDYVMDPLRDSFISEFNYGKIYVAPDIKHQDPFSIRMWSDGAETVSYNAKEWVKMYNTRISLYAIEKNPSEAFYKQFTNDIERVYQLLFEKKGISTTISSGSGSVSSSVTHNYYDGVVDNIEINSFEGIEEEIEGLNVARFEFSCKISRPS